MTEADVLEAIAEYIRARQGDDEPEQTEIGLFGFSHFSNANNEAAAKAASAQAALQRYIDEKVETRVNQALEQLVKRATVESHRRHPLYPEKE